MAADTDDALYEWSTTESNNKPSGSTTVGTNWDDNLRMIQKVTRGWLASKGADIASAGTTDLGAIEGSFHDITGTTTITSFGTVSAGIEKWVKFEGVLTLTHNATSLILLSAGNRTTAVGDVGKYVSEGSGNWRELSYSRANGSEFASGTVLVFNQTNAPTGWTKGATHNDKALRVVTGAVSSGGATAFTSVFGSGKTTGSHTLLVAEVPALAIPSEVWINTPGSSSVQFSPISSATFNITTETVGGRAPFTTNGGGGGHSHTSSLDLQYVDVIVATKD